MAAVYSASVEERATTDCDLLDQLTTPPANIEQFVVTDFRDFSSAAQSESV